MLRREHAWVCASRTELGGDLRTLTSTWGNIRVQDLWGAESFTNIPLYPPCPECTEDPLTYPLFIQSPERSSNLPRAMQWHHQASHWGPSGSANRIFPTCPLLPASCLPSRWATPTPLPSPAEEAASSCLPPEDDRQPQGLAQPSPSCPPQLPNHSLVGLASQTPVRACDGSCSLPPITPPRESLATAGYI